MLFCCFVLEADESEVLNKLIQLMDKTTFRKNEFRRREDNYKNRIRNDVKELDVLDSEDVKSGYHYLYSRSVCFNDFILQFKRLHLLLGR